MLRDLISIVGRGVSWFFSRPTLRVRIRDDEPSREVGGLIFEVENLSDKATSLAPVVTETYISVKADKCRVLFDVRDGDRNLPPFTPRQFSASVREQQPHQGHGWFRTYTFLPTRGRACRVRVRNASLEPLGYWRFMRELIAFRFFGKREGKTSMNVNEYNARQRSRGPH